MDPESSLTFYEEEEAAEDDDLEFIATISFAFFALEGISQTFLQLYYLIKLILPINPQLQSAWQALYQSRNNNTFVVTMGINCHTFDYILQSSFTQYWNMQLIFRDDVKEYTITHLDRCSLDAAGNLILILHYLNSTIAEVTLQQVFSLVPAVCSQYLTFFLHQLLFTLHHISEVSIR